MFDHASSETERDMSHAYQFPRQRPQGEIRHIEKRAIEIARRRNLLRWRHIELVEGGCQTPDRGSDQHGAEDVEQRMKHRQHGGHVRFSGEKP